MLCLIQLWDSRTLLYFVTLTLSFYNNSFYWDCLQIIVSVQFTSVAQSCPTLCNLMNCSTPGLPVHLHLPAFTQTHVHRVCDTIQPSHPRSSPSPPALNPSQHQSLFQWVTLRMRWPKYWSFSFSIIPSKEIPGLISFRMGWLDLLAVQGTLKSLFHHHSSKASILRKLQKVWKVFKN